jgi:Fe-S-cluster formation regulator IscX/YfhJ
MNQEGMMMWQFDAELIATELLLECPNVKLYNFNDKYDIIVNLDNYRDKEHYSSEINSLILEWIAEGDGLVTKDNYLDRLEIEKEYYLNYDYDSIFVQDLIGE